MMQDCNIVDLYWQRDEQAIKETAEKYGSYCYHIAYNILYSDLDAEECVNDTYVKAWESMPPHKPEKLSTYLGKLTRNIAINRYVHDRAQKRNAETDLVFDELSYLIPDGQTSNLPDEVALKDAINRFVGALPYQTRVVFVRRYWYVSPIADIAKDYGLSQGQVKVMLFRTRKKFKAFLEKEGISL
jgi:RNA polymerase sigma-70 factor (ECF subfamily)